ncbi:hypothetical protein U9M48_037027 [Paspalum notatum var. saurae]|uniref:F-box domain-containing protein n=1 Tax=Paspalum notatum var. saurae TaxID=547442 RepID=A0AAQ3X8U9_PASNO
MPPTAKSQVPTTTIIDDLGEDLLCEIFLRLPSLPSLVRAALTCRAFLAAVRSSPAFRRRFRSLHPPPLLGFFFESGSGSPSFSPLRRPSDPDVAAAVRGADAPYQEDEFAGWKIQDCRGGYLLLVDSSTPQMALYSPLTRALDLLPTPPGEISSGCRGIFYMKFTLLCSTEGLESSFRVVCLCHDKDKSRVRVAVFSSGTREWRVLPWWGTPVAQPPGKKNRLLAGTQANGSIYWAHAVQAYMVVLDAKTLQFSLIDLPELLRGRGHLYKSGDTKDGELCIVSAVGLTLYTWFRGADAGGDEKWMLRSVTRLKREILQVTESPEDELAVFRLSLKVWAVLNGIVYMSVSNLDEPRLPSWFLSFCLETRKLEKLFESAFDRRMFPCFMAWPPRLVGDAV